MRKDVKAGLALSFVVIVVGVWYFWGSSSPNEPIALGNKESASPAVTLTARPQPTAVPRTNRNTSRETAQRTSPTSSREDRQTNRDGGAPRIANRPQPQPAEPSLAQAPAATPKPEVVAGTTGDAASASTETGRSESSLPLPAGESVGPRVDGDAPEVDSPVASAPPPNESETDARMVSPRPRSTAVGQSTAMPAGAKPGEGDAAVETYQVRKGDTLAQIAVIFFGSERFVDFLAKSNPQIVSPQSIAEGMVLRIPALPEDLVRAADSTSPAGGPQTDTADREPDAGPTYTVKDGDSFYAIALRTLGAGSRWPEIYELNKGVVGNDPAKLRPGMVLKLPTKDATKSDQARSN